MPFVDNKFAVNNDITISSEDGTFSTTISRKDAELSNMIQKSLAAAQSNTSYKVAYSKQNLELLIEYLTHYAGDTPTSIPVPLPQNDLSKILTVWDKQFVDKVWATGKASFKEFGYLALYFDVTPLIALVSAKWASLIMGLSLSEARLVFDVTSDKGRV